MKKRILIFSLGYYPLPVGGAEVAIKSITDRITPDEYEFHMVCNRYDSNQLKVEQIGNVLVHRIGITKRSPDIADLRKIPLHFNKVLFQWQAFWMARKLHRQYHYDGIWAMMAHSTGVPAAKFKRVFPEAGFALTLQEGDPPEYIERKMRWFEPWFTRSFASADIVQVISNFLGTWAIQKGARRQPVLIPNAVDTKKFSTPASSTEMAVAIKEINKKPGETILVTTSRLVPKNAVDVVIRALPLLPKSVRFVVLGDGPEEQSLHNLVTALHVEDRVTFLGMKANELLPAYLQAGDIFIRPSRSEGMGNSFIEAMAAGLPVIATQVGGISDFLFDATRNPEQKPTGWAVDTDSPEQIAAAIESITANPATAKIVTEHAKQMVNEQYDWDLIAKRMQTEVFDVVTSL